MKKPASDKREPGTENGLLPEYDFDYSKSKPNRFADRIAPDSIAVVLDPDVAAVFRDSASVNALLRAVIATLPEPIGASGNESKGPNKRLQRTAKRGR